MLQTDILKPFTEATPWINSFVLVESKDKSGNLKLHIYLDPTNLNKAITHEPYHFKMPDDIAHLIIDAYIMTVCDCQKGYWYQELDESSSFLTTFNTEFCHYRYTVMPFGATVTDDVFQHKLDQCFGHIPNVIVIADDIMVFGKMQNHRDHNQALTTLLHTSRACNVKLNYEKLQYKQTEVEFWGKTYTVNGCKPAESKAKSIVEMPPPNCKKQVRSFIGMVNYPSKFSAHFSELAESIHELSKEKGTWTWRVFQAGKERNCKCTFHSILQSKEDNCFTYRCEYKRIWSLLATRWKTCLLHKQSPDRGQKGLCDNWTRVLGSGLGYGEIPSLSLCQPFHLETDWKLLEAILSRSLNQANPHLERTLIRTFPYNFTVRYLPGLKNQLVDCLQCVGGLQDSIKLPILNVCQITTS